MNVLVLSGRLTKDFTLKNQVARSSIAVDTYSDEPMYVDITAFKTTAEYCVKYLRKGDKITVSGELNIFKKDGKTYVSCTVNSVDRCGGKRREEDKKENVEVVENDVEIEDNDVAIADDDLPF